MSKAYVIVTLMICMSFTGCIGDDPEEDSTTLKDSVYDVFDWGNTQNWKKWCSYILFTVEDNEITLANNTELDECADTEDGDGDEFKFTISNYTEENLDYRATSNSGFIYSVSAIIEECERPDEFEPWDCIVNFGEDVDEFEMHWVEVGGQWVWWDNPWRGCTDSLAINYNSEAKDDDGTCEYYQFNESVALKWAVAEWNADSNRAKSTYGDISRWDVSSLTDMYGVFYGVKNFNGDISGWDVSSVTEMRAMFLEADNFNSDISGWDVSSVTNMSSMFYGADNFNSDISGWDVSGVTNMNSIFGCWRCNFNVDISSWDVSNVTDMGGMFWGISNFSADISDWDVSNVTDMGGMFNEADNFNGDISGWDVSSVTDMSEMCFDAENFNGDVSGWDVSSVTNMERMFFGADNFSADISGWDVSNVTDMGGMFQYADNFNQDISDWDISSVTDMNYMFFFADSFNQDISDWDVSSVTDMSSMFDNADGLSDDNKCNIHTEFSSNDYWTYNWEGSCSDD